MKYIKIGLLLLIIITSTGCEKNQKKLKEYLLENDYVEKNGCYKKEVKEDTKTMIYQYCIDKCKYYATNVELDDYYTLDLKTLKMTYVLEYITYKSNGYNKEEECSWQGEELDLNNSYCENAKKGLNVYYNQFINDTKKAKINKKLIC